MDHGREQYILGEGNKKFPIQKTKSKTDKQKY